jgi:Leucine-rich repeat (LRR) protein
MPNIGFVSCTAMFLVIAAIGCQVQPEGQTEAIRQLQQLINARGERPHVEWIASDKIKVVIPFNDGRGGGWNDEEFLASVPYLQKIPQLHTLDMFLTKITDVGLSGLEKLPQVRKLNLAGTQITDAGLVSLATMTQLEELSIDSHLITKDALENLRRQLPNTKVNY